MKFIKFIDRKSVKQNPLAGSTEYLVHGRTSFSIHVSGRLPDNCTLAPFCIVESIDDTGTVLQVAGADATYDDVAKEGGRLLTLLPPGASMTIKSRADSKVIHGSPAVPFLFDYMPCPVQCGACKDVYSAEELLSDVVDDTYNDRICPSCGVWNACDLTVESLSASELYALAKQNAGLVRQTLPKMDLTAMQNGNWLCDIPGGLENFWPRPAVKLVESSRRKIDEDSDEIVASVALAEDLAVPVRFYPLCATQAEFSLRRAELSAQDSPELKVLKGAWLLEQAVRMRASEWDIHSQLETLANCELRELCTLVEDLAVGVDDPKDGLPADTFLREAAELLADDVLRDESI